MRIGEPLNSAHMRSRAEHLPRLYNAYHFPSKRVMLYITIFSPRGEHAMCSTLIVAAASIAMVLPMAAQAAESIVSGHITRAVVSVDVGDDEDGVQYGVNFVDTHSSKTRFRFTGSEEAESVTLGVQLEDDSKRHSIRLSKWDLGGVTSWCSYGGTGPTCPSSSRLRYDAPVGPVSAHALSLVDDDHWDTQVSVAGFISDAEYDLRVGHVAENNTDSDVTASSTGAGEGMSIAVAWSEDSGEDHQYGYVKTRYFHGVGSDDLQIAHIVPSCCWPWCPPPRCRRCSRGIVGYEDVLRASAVSIDSMIDVYEELL